MTLIAYLLLGLISGTLAGFFGIGGGVILVPTLLLCFKFLNFNNDIIMHMALGTSLSCILFNSLNSTFAHHKNNNVDWHIFFKLLPGIIIGVILGALLSDSLSSRSLEIIFAIFLTAVLIKMSFKLPSNPEQKHINLLTYIVTGSIIGFKSAILGIGGGTISIPFLVWTGKKMKKAVGVSASIGFPISLFGTLSYIYNGFHQQNLPQYSLGYIYLPAFISIALLSTFSTRLGVKLAHSVSQERIRVLFVIFLLVITTKTYYQLLK